MSPTPRVDTLHARFSIYHEGDLVQLWGLARQLERELDSATLGRCTCSDCGKQVNNAWRDSDGHHCLTCLAKERDEANAMVQDENIPRRYVARGGVTYCIWGTSSISAYKELEKENARLRAGIRACLSENAHLADGENCTLIGLKRLLNPPTP